MAETILVVDDAQFIRLTLKVGLQKVGFHVLEAENGLQAENILNTKNIAVDLVLCDISMPEQDGLTTLEHIRLKYPELPIIMLSAYSDKTNVANCAKLGVNGFISKPFDMNMLRARIFSALKK